MNRLAKNGISHTYPYVWGTLAIMLFILGAITFGKFL